MDLPQNLNYGTGVTFVFRAKDAPEAGYEAHAEIELGRAGIGFGTYKPKSAAIKERLKTAVAETMTLLL